jgi:hypothetical protein
MTATTPAAPSVHITFVLGENNGCRARRRVIVYAARREGGAWSGQSAGIARVGLPGSGGKLGSALRFALTMAAGGARGQRGKAWVGFGSEKLRAEEIREEVLVLSGSGGASKTLTRVSASVSLTTSHESFDQGKARISWGEGRGEGLNIVLTFGGVAARKARVVA